MTPDILQGIVAVQVVLLAVTVILSFAPLRRSYGQALAWTSSGLALIAIVLAGLAAAPGVGIEISGPTSTWITYAGVAFGAALLNWVAFSVARQWASHRADSHLESPKVRSQAGEELREILRREGIELDARLRQAETDREQFLYALEERHAGQIAGLAQEYQQEAHTILRQLLDQLAAEQLLPLVEERIGDHQATIERQLGAIDTAVAGESLTTIRSELTELVAQVESAEARVLKIRAENPDTSMEEHVATRLAAIDGQIEERMAAMQAGLDTSMTTTIAALDARIIEVGSLLDAKVDAASNPLAQRMAETEAAVEQRLQSYMDVLANRFGETEEILNTRIIEQEQALEARVIQLEGAVDGRLGEHSTAIEGVLAAHDEQLHAALGEQTTAIGAHFSGERDRLIAELTEHALTMQEQVAAELVSAEGRARETVEATQQAWNQFTAELEERFAVTREEALRAAKEIAQAERMTLETELASLTQGASGEISAKVEELGREAAWQRAQVERVVGETMDYLKNRAGEALHSADDLFAQLDRIGAERVDAIRRQAEDALVQSRDYVGQLQDSLGNHLDQLRERSGSLADEMNERLNTITIASQQAAQHVESYSRDIVDSTGRELAAVAEQQVLAMQQRIAVDLTQTIQTNLEQQQRAYEAHLGEISQRIMQQVQGDLAGLAEHARGAVTGELDQIVGQAREHARAAQEQGFAQIMGDLARMQGELADQARAAGDQTRSLLDDALRNNRRQLEEAMASMGAHMREELVRFQDEGQRRVDSVIDHLRSKEHDLLREEDRKLSAARGELVRRHQGALEQQVKDLVGGLGGVLGSSPVASQAGGGNGLTLGAHVEQPPVAPLGSFAQGIERPATPLVGGYDPVAQQQQQPAQPQPQQPYLQHQPHAGQGAPGMAPQQPQQQPYAPGV